MPLLWNMTHTHFYFEWVLFFIVSHHWNWYNPSRSTWHDVHCIMDIKHISYTQWGHHMMIFLPGYQEDYFTEVRISNIQHNKWIANLVWKHCVYVTCLISFAHGFSKIIFLKVILQLQLIFDTDLTFPTSLKNCI